ncbi:MAG TPA: prolyl-tRNA synthetase associated domain-containing protein [Saliniramus sp.]|nr:prolyl-tRNA synthetase associated domain-containing protein [Saliniramus sp.]
MGTSKAMMTPQQLLAALDKRGYATTTTGHEAVFTVAESQHVKARIPGGHTKNLFLKDKKGRIFLVTAESESPVDLKRLHPVIGGSGRLSFGSAELLGALLGVEPGSVTPLALVNAPPEKISFVLDRRLADQEIINAHPLINTMTTSMRVADLISFLAEHGHETRIRDLPVPPEEKSADSGAGQNDAAIPS